MSALTRWYRVLTPNNYWRIKWKRNANEMETGIYIGCWFPFDLLDGQRISSMVSNYGYV